MSTYVFALGLLIKCAVDPDTLPSFSLYELRVEVRDHLAWLGAIFAAAYTGFYARYASQWNYISSLYNQIMATASTRTAARRPGRRDLRDAEAELSIFPMEATPTWTPIRPSGASHGTQHGGFVRIEAHFKTPEQTQAGPLLDFARKDPFLGVNFL